MVGQLVPTKWVWPYRLLAPLHWQLHDRVAEFRQKLRPKVVAL